MAGGIYLFRSLDNDSASDSSELGEIVTAPPTPTSTPTPTPVPTPLPDLDTVSFISNKGEIAIGYYEPRSQVSNTELQSFYAGTDSEMRTVDIELVDRTTVALLTQTGSLIERDRDGNQIVIWEPQIRNGAAINTTSPPPADTAQTETDPTETSEVKVSTFTIVSREPRIYALGLDNAELLLAEQNPDSSFSYRTLIPAQTSVDTQSAGDTQAGSETPRRFVDMAFSQNHIGVLSADGLAQSVELDSAQITQIWTDTNQRAGMIHADVNGFSLGVGAGLITSYDLNAETEPIQLIWDHEMGRPPAVAFAPAGQDTVIVTNNGSVTSAKLWGDGTAPVLLWDAELYRVKARVVDANEETAIIVLENGGVVRAELENPGEPVLLYDASSAFGRFHVVNFLKE